MKNSMKLSDLEDVLNYIDSLNDNVTHCLDSKKKQILG